jgi:hypothetical protein
MPVQLPDNAVDTVQTLLEDNAGNRSATIRALAAEGWSRGQISKAMSEACGSKISYQRVYNTLKKASEAKGTEGATARERSKVEKTPAVEAIDLTSVDAPEAVEDPEILAEA